MLQVFSLTVVFGLFHGLVLLPVVLSILGPSSPSHSDSESVTTSSVSTGSSRSESPARPVKVQDNKILNAQWTSPA